MFGNSSDCYGITNSTDTSSVIIGIKDTDIDKEAIIIESYFGINNLKGDIYWYDGTIRYKGDALSGSITEIEDNAQIVKNNEEIYLEIVEPVEYIQNKTTGNVYTDLQMAINEADIQDTLQVMQDYQQNEKIYIPEEKQIVLDLNGKMITSYGCFQNQGNFIVIDSIGNGSFTSDIGIYNASTGSVTVSRRNGF